MRVAVIADIHGNLVALDAVLGRLRGEPIDRIVCLGDVASGGPQPREVVARLRALNCPMVMGNAEAQLMRLPSAESESSADEQERRKIAMRRWCVQALSPADLDFLRQSLPTVTLPLGGDAALLCYHGSPHSYYDLIFATTPDEELDRMLAGFSATVMAGGHTHLQLLRRHKEMLILNPGSVGWPWPTELSREGKARNPSWAEYALVGWEDGDLNVELRRVPLDPGLVIQAALDSDLPDSYRQWWMQGWA